MYLKKDWTSISDIGKSFENELLTTESYKKSEDSYIKAIIMAMEYLHIPFLSVNNILRSFSCERFVEMREDCELYSQDIIEMYNQVKDGDKLYIGQVDSFCRLLLREDIGSDIFYPRRMKIFIGYDYLMGFHTSKSMDTIIPFIEQLNLFVEKY
ncbi:hypothetical protein ACE3MZ_13605 [Paenibacillus sp. WLX1005]|uniref:hypothetical protein n=1 Tax=Paenibacillus sp. WLX1005 TaxID=3243766 RepID=UPI0039845270